MELDPILLFCFVIWLVSAGVATAANFDAHAYLAAKKPDYREVVKSLLLERRAAVVSIPAAIALVWRGAWLNPYWEAEFWVVGAMLVLGGLLAIALANRALGPGKPRGVTTHLQDEPEILQPHRGR